MAVKKINLNKGLENDNESDPKANKLPNEKITNMAKKEYNILKQLDHPYIMRLVDVYKDDSYYNFVTEFCEGKELFDEIKIQKRMPE